MLTEARASKTRGVVTRAREMEGAQGADASWYGSDTPTVVEILKQKPLAVLYGANFNRESSSQKSDSLNYSALAARRSDPLLRSRPMRCSGKATVQKVIPRQVGQCFWIASFSSPASSRSWIRNALDCPQPSHLSTQDGIRFPSSNRLSTFPLCHGNC